MNYSSIFKNAHQHANATKESFDNYRDAFSDALSWLMKQAWAEAKREAEQIKDAISCLTKNGALIANTAKRAEQSGEAQELYNYGGYVVSIEDNYIGCQMTLTMTAPSLGTIDKKVRCTSSVVRQIKKWLKAL